MIKAIFRGGHLDGQSCEVPVAHLELVMENPDGSARTHYYLGRTDPKTGAVTYNVATGSPAGRQGETK
jgi:hypothetical protein